MAHLWTYGAWVVACDLCDYGRDRAIQLEILVVYEKASNSSKIYCPKEVLNIDIEDIAFSLMC